MRKCAIQRPGAKPSCRQDNNQIRLGLKDIDASILGDPSAITLEHVLPQNSDDDWDGIDADTRNTSVRRLGNVCLIQ